MTPGGGGGQGGGLGGGGGGGFGGGGGAFTRGPRVLPGVYEIALVVGKEESRAEIEVVGEPRIAFTRSEERAYRSSMEKLAALYRVSGRIRSSVASVRGQLATVEAAEAYKSGSAELKASVEEIKKQVAMLETLAGTATAASTDGGRRGPGPGTGGGGQAPGATAPAQQPPPASPSSDITRMLAILADMESWTEAPSRRVQAEIARLEKAIRKLAGDVNGLGASLGEANSLLKAASIPPLGAPERISFER
jgi:hypothetical protein